MASGGEDLSDETFDFLCNTCQDNTNINSRAVDYCRQCSKYFCEGCLNEHNGKSAWKHHTDKLLGRDILQNLSNTRQESAATDDVVFCCRTCSNAGSYRTAVDYCRQCGECMCDTCLIGHNKWTHHDGELLGHEDMEQMIRARNLSRQHAFSGKITTGTSSRQGKITRNTENYCRLAVLIVKGCTRIMRSLFLRHIESSTPANHLPSPWTVDEFLSANKTDICKKLGKEKGMLPGIKENILFPSHGATDLEKWDLVLLSFILLDVCNYKVQQPLAMHLNKMKKVRNSICHRGDASVTNDDFDLHFDQIKTSIEMCCNFLADKAIKDEMRSLVHDVEQSTLSLDESSMLLKKWYESDKHIEERLELHTKALQTVDAHVVTMGADVQTMSADVRTMMSKINVMCDIFSMNGAKIDIETKLGMYMKNCEPEKETALSEKLVRMIDPKLRDDPRLKEELSDPSYLLIYRHLTEAMEELLSSEREVSDASSKCVIISVRCTTYSSFQDLLYQSSTGGLTDLFKPVERAIRMLDGYEDVSLEVVISEEEFWKTMDTLVTNLIAAYGCIQDDQAVEQVSTIDETERETDDSTTDYGIKNVSILSPEECEDQTGSKDRGTCILINVKPRSIGQYMHIMECGTSESVKTALQDLADVLKDVYQLTDLSIEARPVVAKTSRPAIGYHCLETELTFPEPEELQSTVTDEEEGLLSTETDEKDNSEPKYMGKVSEQSKSAVLMKEMKTDSAYSLETREYGLEQMASNTVAPLETADSFTDVGRQLRQESDHLATVAGLARADSITGAGRQLSDHLADTAAPLGRAGSIIANVGRLLWRQSGHLATVARLERAGSITGAGRQPSTRNVVSTSRQKTIEEGKMLFSHFVQEELSRATDLEAPKQVQDELDIWATWNSRQWKEVGAELRRYADDFRNSLERQKIKRKAREMSTMEGMTKEQFSDLLSNFLVGGITRGGILVLFFFCSDIAIATLSRNSQSSAALCSQLLEWSFQFIAERVCSWVQEHGGWEAVFSSSLEKIGKAALVVGFALVCYFGVRRLMQ